MENTNRDTATHAAPQQDGQNAEKNVSVTADANTQNDARSSVEANGYGMDATDDQRLSPKNDTEDKEENEVEEDDEKGDWGHVDPAESNSPFPDSNDPSSPGSAV